MQYSDCDLEMIFNEFLDETYFGTKIGGCEYKPSDVLKKVDPEEYRCYLSSHIDYLLIKEIIFKHSDNTYHDEPERELVDLSDLIFEKPPLYRQ